MNNNAPITTFEFITPEIAMEYLKLNMACNRPINARRVKELTTDIQNGNWQLNGDTIRFNKKGELIDGQHRLTAIAKSGCTVMTGVTRNIENDVTIIDRGRIRSTSQVLQMGGLDKSLCSHSSIGMIKLLLSMSTGRKSFTSDSSIREIIEAHREYIILSRSITGTGKNTESTVTCNNSSFQAAVFCALYAGESEDMLRRFASVVKTGFADTLNERAAIVCRNDILAGNIAFSKTKDDSRKIAVAQVEKAIYDFCRRTARRQSYKNQTEYVYPTIDIL